MLSDKDLDLIFRQARSFSTWTDKPVSEVTLQAVYDLMRWGPTSANCSPARLVFLASDQAKERIKPHLARSNVDKVMTSPVTVIIASDSKFYDRMPELFPDHPNARDWFTSSEALMVETAFRNSTLQGAYLMIAARALGLDCGPMSDFNPDGVNSEFFPDGQVETNFICGLGYGIADDLPRRSPRLAFDDACQIL